MKSDCNMAKFSPLQLGSLQIQSPSENGNGTQCLGGDWTPQSAAENKTGCLGDVLG